MEKMNRFIGPEHKTEGTDVDLRPGIQLGFRRAEPDVTGPGKLNRIWCAKPDMAIQTGSEESEENLTS